MRQAPPRRPATGPVAAVGGPDVELLEVDLGPGARGFFTTRGTRAAVSRADPYAGLNPAAHVGDDPRRVGAARAALEERISQCCGGPVPLAWMNQVHSAVVASAGPQRGLRDVPTADALVLETQRDPHWPRGVGVLVADCVPLLLAAGDGSVVAAVHAGRRGMLEGVVPAALEALSARGAPPSQIRAALGPSICGRCYEVGQELHDEAVALEPACGATTRWGTPGLDVAAGVVAQLERHGVAHVEAGSWCTLEDPRFYSYRRDGRTGRLAGVAVAV